MPLNEVNPVRSLPEGNNRVKEAGISNKGTSNGVNKKIMEKVETGL